MRQARLAASALAVAAVVAGAWPGQANAAPGAQGPEAERRRADGRGHPGQRHDRASPEGRPARHAPGRLRRRLGRLQLRPRRTSRRSTSTPGPATTPCASTRATASSPTPSRRRSTAESETTPSPEAQEQRRWSAAPGTTRSTGTGAATSRSWAPATTRSPGIRATAATPSRDRPAPTRCVFNGANVSEQIDLSANGSRLRLFRDVGNITMDTDGVETGRPQRARRRRHDHRRTT